MRLALPDIFRREIEANFNFLRDHGYQEVRFSSERDKLLGNIEKANYRSRDRDIEIALVRDEKRAPFVTVDISRLPRKSIDDDLDVSLFVRKYDPEVADKIARIEQESPTAEELIHSVLPMYKSILSGMAGDIVAGRQWESGFYTDWT